MPSLVYRVGLVILESNYREKWDEMDVVVEKHGTFFGRVNCGSKICFFLIVERKGIFRPNYRGERDKSSVMVEENGISVHWMMRLTGCHDLWSEIVEKNGTKNL